MTTLASRIGLAVFARLADYANDEMMFGFQCQPNHKPPRGRRTAPGGVRRPRGTYAAVCQAKRNHNTAIAES